MQIPILNGIYADTNGDFRTSYPRNLIPIPKEQGISKGYLKPADGIVSFSSASVGLDRGAINWKGVLYRVSGTKLVSYDILGIATILGDVGGIGQVTLDYSFDLLAIASGNNLFYWDGVTLRQVTDFNLGFVVDFVWIDGYFLTTDGNSLIVTDLNDPFLVNPLKYGSSESDPDPVIGVLKLHNQAYAINRYTIEVFRNIGGSLFPFQRIDGALINRGAIGTFTFCEFEDAVAFLGGGRNGNKNESPSIWLGVNGQSVKLATREIDIILQGYTETQLSTAILEVKVDKAHRNLYVHLPDQTLVYDAAASAVLETPVWYFLTSSLIGLGTYKARNFIWCYDKWISGDPTSSNLGYFVTNISSYYGIENGWEFGTLILYNKARDAIVHELELIALTGHVDANADPSIWTSYSKDGETFSMERAIKAGKQGDRIKRLVWLQNGSLSTKWRIQKFRGTSSAHISMAALEARIEPLK